MKHITDFKNHLAALRGVCDDNGNLPESRDDLSRCSYNGQTPDLTTDEGYDTWSDFVFAVHQAIKVANGTAARVVEELAERVGEWRYDD